MLLGLVATLAVAVAYLAGLDQRAELQALDFRFRYFPTAPQTDQIVHIDIDDRSLEELARWPWPREMLSGVIEVLEECGARTVALDIILPEPENVRYVSPVADIYNSQSGELLGAPAPQPVFDDAILAETLKNHPNIFLPLYIDFKGSKDETIRQDIDQAVARLLRQGPQMGFEQVLAALAGESGGSTGAAQRDFAARSYLRHRSLIALARFAIPVEQVSAQASRSGLAVPPLVTLAQNAHHSGFVTVEPDSDGVVRRIPLLGQTDYGVFPQFAMALAAHELARQHGGSVTITAGAGSVSLRCPDGENRAIPVDPNGMMIINWHRRSEGEQARPRHLSAAAVGSIWLDQQRISNNERRLRLLALKLISPGPNGSEPIISSPKLVSLFERADGLYTQRVQLELNLQRATLFDPQIVRIDAMLQDLRKIKDQEKATESAIREESAELTDEVYAPPATHSRYKEITYIRDAMRALLAAQKDSKTAVDASMDKLRPLVGDKICMLGSNATGAADFVPTPMANRDPGVVMHSNIINTILSGMFVRQSDVATNILVILLAGAVVSLVVSRWPVLLAAPAVIAFGAAYAVFNAGVLFGVLRYWLVLVAPLAAMLASLLTVTAYRQLTEERAKRHIRKMFAHALSPALVDRLIEDPSLLEPGRRVLTCFFSDLKGFTPLSERLGEQETVRLLKRYFDRMTEVIQNRRGGYLNKFLGDGLFVFFGAPIFQDDHCARAIQAAIDCQDEVVRLNEILAKDYAGQFDQPVQLGLRIGLATGEVMVGDCGSSDRFDYTAIGDTVNLASRLEGANKFFGTKILAAEETWRRGGGDHILARPLGRVIVLGKIEPVGVWEVRPDGQPQAAGQAGGQGQDTIRQAFAGFARGIELFASRQFVQAAETFQNVLKIMPQDKPAETYLALCRQYQAQPPRNDWDAALTLTEK